MSKGTDEVYAAIETKIIHRKATIRPILKRRQLLKAAVCPQFNCQERPIKAGTSN